MLLIAESNPAMLLTDSDPKAGDIASLGTYDRTPFHSPALVGSVPQFISGRRPRHRAIATSTTAIALSFLFVALLLLATTF